MLFMNGLFTIRNKSSRLNLISRSDYFLYSFCICKKSAQPSRCAKIRTLGKNTD